MKITSVNIPESFGEKGLKEINMDRLGDTVILAGKNGSGKTRLLDIIFEAVHGRILSTEDYIEAHDTIKKYREILTRTKDEFQASKLLKVIENKENNLLVDSYFKFDSRKNSYNIVKFVPKYLELNPPINMTLEQKDRSHILTKNLHEIENINQHVLAYIQKECDNNFYATHQSYVDDPESLGYRESFKKLNDLIDSFLGTQIGMKENRCTLFNRPLENAKLSEGQNVLLQLCVQVHAHSGTLDDLILILDEPEKHLHPAAQIEFIKKVKEILTNGQIWIATHSIHILSYLETSDIWYMRNGGVKYAGRQPEKALKGLMGNEDQIERLQDFIGLPSVLAANQFAYECLHAPGVADASINDPQTNQISAILDEIRKNNEKLSILDFGAGKGRLISAIWDNSCDKSTVKDWLDYIAFDTYEADKTKCEQAIKRVYENSDNRYFNDIIKLQEYRDARSVNVVVMCNVLHEISPDDWVRTFDQNSPIFKLLSDDGYMLIIEDTVIPKGERPNYNGFFILNRLELKTLFNISAADKKFVSQSYENKERLFAHLVPKAYLKNITADSKTKAIEELCDRCKKEINRIRTKTDYRSGKLLGLWSQQLANAVVYLK